MMVRCMTIRALGIDLGNGRKLMANLNCRILNYGAAKTLYRQRRPICSSLDTVKALKDPKKLCQQCLDRNHCTGQVRVDLLFEYCPYPAAAGLAYTSAKNFLLYTGKLAQQQLEIQTIDTKIIVVNRGSWGELRFFPAHR